LEYTELREYGHGVFAETAEALGDASFQPYLVSCVERARASLELEDGVVYDSEDDEGERSDSDSDSEDDRGRDVRYSVFSGVVEEKAAACRAIASYAHFCPESFAPFVERFAPQMRQMCDHMHDVVRTQAHAALARIAQCALIAAGPVDFTNPSVGPDASPAFEVVDCSLHATHSALTEDDDRDAVCAAMEAAAEVIKSVARRDGVDLDAVGAAPRGDSNAGDRPPGPGVARLHSGNHVEALSMLCLAVLEGRAVCQEDVEDDDECDANQNDSDSDSDEEAELGVVVLEGCAELLPALVGVSSGSPNGFSSFEPHFAALSRRVSPSRPEGQRSIAYATLVEMVKHMGTSRVARGVAFQALAGCVGEMKRAATSGLRRNCAYCAGVFVEICGAALPRATREDVARALCGVFARREDSLSGGTDDSGFVETDPGTRDNAAGAASRVLFAADAAVLRDAAGVGPPLLDALLVGIPLRDDFEECASAYGGCAKLFDLANEIPQVAERLPGLVAAAARVAAERSRSRGSPKPKSVPEPAGPTREVLATLVAALRRFAGSGAEQSRAVEMATAGLPEDQRNALARLVAELS